jgi:hypothetical protein
MKKLDTVDVITISTIQGRAELNALLDEKGKPNKEWIWLTFYTSPRRNVEIETWDNNLYIKDTLERLCKKEYTYDLLDFIEENGFNKKQVRKELVTIYDRAKKLGLI